MTLMTMNSAHSIKHAKILPNAIKVSTNLFIVCKINPTQVSYRDDRSDFTNKTTGDSKNLKEP